MKRLALQSASAGKRAFRHGNAGPVSALTEHAHSTGQHGSAKQKKQKKDSYKQGQLSLEMLILIGVNLSVFILLLPSIMKSREIVESNMAMLSEQRALSDLSNTADMLCILGPRNRQDLSFVFSRPVNVSAYGTEMIIESKEQIQTASTKCETDIVTIQSFQNSKLGIELENVGGRIIGKKLEN